MGLSWSGYVLWTNTPDVLEAAVLSAHDCRLAMEYVLSLFVTKGYKAVATNTAQCGIPWGGQGYGSVSVKPKVGSQEYIEPWNRAPGDARFVDFCENSLVYAGENPYDNRRDEIEVETLFLL